MTATAVKHGKTKAFKGQNNSYARAFFTFSDRPLQNSKVKSPTFSWKPRRLNIHVSFSEFNAA